MKKLLLLLTACFYISQFSFAIPIDSITGLKDSLKVISVNTKETRDSAKSISLKLNKCNCHEIKTDEWFWEWFLVFLPIILFIVLFFVLGAKLKDFSFKEALTENELIKVTIKNPQ